MFPGSYLSLLGSLFIYPVFAQNESCSARAPAGYNPPQYGLSQPFLPYYAPEGTQSFDDSDTTGVITYSGDWTSIEDPTAVNSTLHSTNDTSASVSFTFTGTGIEWFGTAGEDHGTAKVTIDTVPPTTEEVDGSSSHPYKQQRLWSKLELPLRKYTLTIHNTVRHGTGNLLDVDAFVVTTIPPFALEGGRISHGSDGWSLIEKGMTGVGAMQLAIISPTHALIFDKVEHNYASIGGRPAWSVLYDLNTHELHPLSLQSNTLCGSGSFLSNGTLISLGGNRAGINDTDDQDYHDEDGRQSFRIFEPCLSPSGDCDILDMVNASSVTRWYPTALRITDGSMLILGGGHENVFENNHSINEPSVSFFPSLPSSPAKFPLDFFNRTLNANLFPHAFSLPNKRAFIIANTESIILNWGASPPKEEANYTIPNGVRLSYPMAGTAMLLPLSAQDNYTARILACGGTNASDQLCDFEYSAHYPASNQCSRIEIKRDGTTEGWKVDDPMPDGPRVMPDSVLLPTGEVVITGGARAGYMGIGNVIDVIGLSNAADPARSPITYSADKQPGSRFKQLLVKTDIPRLYHSSAILTPNGDVMIAGSNPNNDRALTTNPTDYRVEWLRPPYMDADRPTYTGLGSITGYGTKFTLDVHIPSSLNRSKVKVSLMDLGFSTHSMHVNTRLVYLENTLSGNKLTVMAPPDAAVYSPGPAYIFVVVDNVPSKALYTLIGDGKPPVPH